MPEFTKGKWEAGKVEGKNQWLIISDRDTEKENVIAEIHNVYEIIAPRRMNALPAETEANARLIASAPDMYKILSVIWDMLSEVDLDADIEDDIHEILKYIDRK